MEYTSEMLSIIVADAEKFLKETVTQDDSESHKLFVKIMSTCEEPISELGGVMAHLVAINPVQNLHTLLVVYFVAVFQSVWKTRESYDSAHELLDTLDYDPDKLSSNETEYMLKAALKALGKGVRAKEETFKDLKSLQMKVVRGEGSLGVVLAH